MATEATVAIEAIEAIQAWGASWRSRRVQTLLVRFLLAPLEFPKLANAQPSNFGPLRMFREIIYYFPSLLPFDPWLSLFDNSH